MKRSQSRAASPTPTAFSGISNYRTESYRPIKDKNPPAVPSIDYRLVSKAHHDELTRSLAVYLANSSPNSRSTARQKLTRLTIQQFHELSTDVYDELMRRKRASEIPFLPVREEFHPKRNQARQKLATLPTSRFEDLSSDVYYELSRRYPEFKEDPQGGRTSNNSNYDDYPAPDFPTNSPPRAVNNSRTSGRASLDRPGDSGYGGSISSRRPSQDRRRPSDADFPPPRRSEDSYRAPSRTSEDNYGASSSSYTSRRKPSQDTAGRRSEDRDRGEFPPRRAVAPSISGTSDITVNAQSTTATSAMIIPNKSTMEEEYIEVPYGRDNRESNATIDEADIRRDSAQEPPYSAGFTDPEPDSASDYPMTPRSPPASGLNGLSARLQGADDEKAISPSRVAFVEDTEKLKQDYEYRIAAMENQISSLQRNLAESEDTERQLKGSEAKVQQLEDELTALRRRAEEQSTSILMIQRELDDLRETRLQEKEREARRAREDEDELEILRDRCERLESEKGSAQQVFADSDAIEQLRSDMEGLVAELSDISGRNDELMIAKDSDLNVIRDLDNQLKDYKRKYEQAKTELRNVKATSQLFLPTPKRGDQDGHLPFSNDGGVLDIHLTAFLSATDQLLTAGRTNAPTKVLSPMKAVVNAVTSIIDDLRAFERRPLRDRADVDQESLHGLQDRAETTLSNLVASAKTHATSAGLSPVSLLDAAASHVSATVTEICKTIFIRKASSAEQENFSALSPGPVTASFSSLRFGEDRSNHQRTTSSVSNSSFGRGGNNRIPAASPMSPKVGIDALRRRTPSEHSSSEHTNSPPPIFDQPRSIGIASGDSSNTEGTEDNWAELKPYLEAQTESIVYAIQSVLAGVRSPTPSPTLNENITQIITIVSSIVAVCTDNLPPGTAQQGNDILRELSDHANKLSEIQTQGDVTKESRQVMAKSSFAVANAMKGLMKL